MAIYINFDQAVPKEYDENDTQEAADKRHEEAIRKIKYEPIKIPEYRIKELLETGYDCVVVNSFGDDYHMDEQEREANNQFYKVFKNRNRMKNIQRRVDEYVRTVRATLDCLNLVAESNGLYSPEKFKKMYLKGKINIAGLKFPKLKGRAKKDYDTDYLTEFILSDEDPKDILPNYQRHGDDYLDDDDEVLKDKLFDKDELKEILTPLTEEEERYRHTFFNVETDDPDNSNIAITLNEKESKELLKAEPKIAQSVKDMRRAIRSSDNLNRSFLRDIIYDDMSEIEKYDQKYQYKSKSDMPEFTGDIMDTKAYDKYMMKLDKYMKNNIKMNYAGKFKTLAEIEELEVKALLEENDWNLRAFVVNKEREKKLRKISKFDRQKEKNLKKKLLSIEERKKRRMGDFSEEDYKKYKKKMKEKKRRQKSKGRSEAKKDIKKGIENELLKASGKENMSFKEYEEEALDLTNLFNREQ